MLINSSDKTAELFAVKLHLVFEVTLQYYWKCVLLSVFCKYHTKYYLYHETIFMHILAAYLAIVKHKQKIDTAYVVSYIIR